MIIDNTQYTLYYSDNIIVDSLNIIVNNIKQNTVEIFVHNLNFDGIVIIDYISKKFITFTLVAEKTNIYSIRIAYCNKTIIFKCSYKIIPHSLKMLGEIEKFPKTEFPYKFVNENTLYYNDKIPSKTYWEKNDFDAYILHNNIDNFNLKDITIKYCLNDVILTQKVLINLFKIIDEENESIRKKSLSAPSISHKLFYKKYNELNISKNLSLDEENYIRSSYFGGRCEVFGNIDSDEYVKYFDFSGMYGQCMLENFHNDIGTYCEPAEITNPGFYNINYNSDFSFLPILPSHYNEKLMFSNGEQKGTFWFEEIQLFEKMGGKVLKINNAITYNKYEQVFNQFIHNFNKIKEKGGYYKIFGKLMINSLYGSMALKSKENFQYITFSEEEFDNIYQKTDVENFYKINDCFVIIITSNYKAKHFFKKINSNELMTERNVSYASAIASKARIKLYKAMLNVIKDGGRLLYCDTDSIFAAYNKDDLRNKTNDFEWIDFYSDSVFIAPKTYALKKEKEVIIKIKGINDKNVSFDELKEKFYMGNNKLKFENQLNFRKSDFSLKQFYIDKEICLSSYNKRIFINNKKSTIPTEY